MLLVQKPPTFNLTPVVPYAHRRHPSAPVVVQPTKTPGLLSISKPQRTTPQRQLASQQRQGSPKQAPKSKQQPQETRAPALLNPVQISDKKNALQDPASPTPQNRGRASKHARDKAQQSKRSCSPSPVRGRHSRQPSPPVEDQIQSTQAEDQIPSHNQFDPFLSSDALPETPSKQRRQQRQQPSPALSESIPVPTKVVKPQPQKLSRSAPKPSTMFPSPPRTFQFPICDEESDASEPDSAGVPTPPATPLRKNAFGDKSYLINAPISTDSAAFGRLSLPSSQKGRKHRRAPSEGMFSMSSDEDVSSDVVALSENLFGFARNRAAHGKVPVTPTPSLTRSGGLAVAKELNGSPASGQKTAGFFASSLFQNSPSPDELPDPLLF